MGYEGFDCRSVSAEKKRSHGIRLSCALLGAIIIVQPTELVVDWYNSIQIADHYAYSGTARISELVEGCRAHQREHRTQRTPGS